MPHTRTNWANYQAPALNALNLNNIEAGIWYALVHSGGVRNTAEFLDRNPGSTTGGLAEAIADLGGAPGVIFAAPHNHPIPAGGIPADTIPANIHLMVSRGATLTIANAVTLTINGTIEAGLYQVFAWAGTGTVVFGIGSVERVYPQWWGAVGDGVADDATPLQAALTAAAGSELYLPPAIYNTSTTPLYDTTVSGRIKISGGGPNSIIRSTGAVNKALHIQGSMALGHDFVYLSDFRVEGYNSGSAAAMIHLEGVAAYGMERINIDGRVLSDIGLLLDGVGTTGVQQGEIDNCSFFSNLIGLQMNAGGANATDIHGCTFAGNTVRDVWYDTNSPGAAEIFFHRNHLVYGDVAAVAIELGVNCSVKPSFHDNHIEGSYVSVFKVLGGQLDARYNRIFGGGIGVTNAFDISAGSYHDIVGNTLIKADAIITGGVPINYLFNSVFEGDESTTVAIVSFGNRHFGPGTVMPVTLVESISPNEINNSSFERDSNADGLADNWTAAGAVVLAMENVIVLHEQNSQKITTNVANEGVFCDNMLAPAGATMAVAYVWVCRPAAGSDIQVILTDLAVGNRDTQLLSTGGWQTRVVGANTWHRIVLSSSAIVAGNNHRLTIQAVGAAATVFYVDMAYLGWGTIFPPDDWLEC